MESQGAESSEFWKALGESPTPHIGVGLVRDYTTTHTGVGYWESSLQHIHCIGVRKRKSASLHIMVVLMGKPPTP